MKEGASSGTECGYCVPLSGKPAQAPRNVKIQLRNWPEPCYGSKGLVQPQYEPSHSGAETKHRRIQAHEYTGMDGIRDLRNKFV